MTRMELVRPNELEPSTPLSILGTDPFLDPPCQESPRSRFHFDGALNREALPTAAIDCPPCKAETFKRNQRDGCE